jgi:hypothetical protein
MIVKEKSVCIECEEKEGTLVEGTVWHLCEKCLEDINND